MTKAELQAALDAAGIEYPGNAKNAELEQLLAAGTTAGGRPTTCPAGHPLNGDTCRRELNSGKACTA
jgi:hypothetical protein